MSPGRVLRRGIGLAATLTVRVLARLAPQRWCPPAISLRLFGLSAALGIGQTADDVRRHQPAATWVTRTNLRYAGSKPDGLFDLVLPLGAGPHPVVVWLHGGGWHFGDKALVLPYLEILASRGFAGVALNYPLAPRNAYPAAPSAVNDALGHLLANADEYGIDPTRLVLAGDSAGAQVAAEVATLLTNPAFAGECGLAPAPVRPRGTLLFCGIYDTDALDDSDRMFEAALQSAMWSLSRTRSWKASTANHLMSIRHHVTAEFPPTFLASGNTDPLTRRQSPPFAARLRELGVDVDEYRVGTEAMPANHEFQFRLGDEAGAKALEDAVAFLNRVTAGKASNSH